MAQRRWPIPSPSTNRISSSSPRSSDHETPVPASPGRARIAIRYREIGKSPPMDDLSSQQTRQDVGGGVPILSLAGISKRFPGVRALNKVGLELRAGEVT